MLRPAASSPPPLSPSLAGSQAAGQTSRTRRPRRSRQPRWARCQSQPGSLRGQAASPAARPGDGAITAAGTRI
eukprot:16447253-Heterocapsa_arctica.AAC.1